MEQQNKTLAITLAIVTILIVGGTAYWWQHSSPKSQAPTSTITPTTDTGKNSQPNPLAYSTNSLDVSVSKETKPFGYTPEQLSSMAEECGSNHPSDYFNSLVAKFNSTDKIVYNFKYQGASQDSDTYIVTLLPNKAGYSTLDQFKKDFDICAAGGDAYPALLNNDWLLFTSSCGTGFDDGSGKPIGCQKIRDIVEPTLQLNP